MIVIVVLLSLITCFSLWTLYTRRKIIDDSKVLTNRSELMSFAIDDWKQGKIDKNLYRALSFVFHPDFKNTCDYVPPEWQEYTRQINRVFSLMFRKTSSKTPENIIKSRA